MLTKEMIKNIIINAITSVCGTRNIEDHVNIVGKSIDIFPADFLYIFSIIEKEVGIAVHRIFEKYSYEVMTIENMTDAIYEIYTHDIVM